MKQYHCTGNCCEIGRALPNTTTTIVTREGVPLNGEIDTLLYYKGRASCFLRLDTGQLCELICTKKIRSG